MREPQEMAGLPPAEALSPGERYVQMAKEYPNFEEVDWRHAPLKWKLYRGCPTISLGIPGDFSARPPEIASFPLSAASLGQMLASMYGLTRQHWLSVEGLNAQISGTTMATLDPQAHAFKMELLRPVPSGGGLFPAEIYLALTPGTLASPATPGLYHYDALHHALDLLDPAPVLPVLTQALTGSMLAQTPITLLLTCSFWKTAFKYGAFSYRLHSQDLGVLVAQCLEVARAFGMSATVHYQFLDPLLNQWLDLDPSRESVYAVITLTSALAPVQVASYEPDHAARPQVEPIAQMRPISEFPLLAELHARALYHTRADLRPPGSLEPLPTPSGERVALPPAQRISLLSALKRRHSARNAFQPGALSHTQFTRLLQVTTEGYANDLDGEQQSLQHLLLYCLVSRVENVAPGVYCYVPHTGELLRVYAGDLHLAYQQSMLYINAHNAYQASLSLFPVGCYSSGFCVYGDRWYRIQNMEAGLLLQRLYLAAAALGIGCHASLAYSVESVDRLLQLPAGHMTLAQVMLAPEKTTGQFYELPLIC